MRFLDPVTIARIKSFRYRELGIHSEGSFTGQHRSASRGFSQEFAQHKPYSDGDDTKFIDWKVYARKDRFFIKEFQEEKNLRLYLLVDSSGSMSFGEPDKWEYAARLAMSVACLSLMKGDSCGLWAFSDSTQTEIIPRSSLKQLKLLDSSLAGITPQGNSSFTKAFGEFLPGVSRRSALVLFSDLMGDPGPVLEAVRLMRAKKHSVYVFHVLAPSERDLPWDGSVSFEDSETFSRCLCRPAALRELYQSEFSRWLRLCESTCRSADIFYFTCFTDTPWDRVMAKFLKNK